MFVVDSLDLVVRTQVAVLAKALSVENSVLVGTLAGLLCSSLSMVAVLAHSIGIVRLSLMSTF